MDEAELSAQLRALLADELADRVRDLERTVLALARAPADGELRSELRRLAHVIKGASRSASVAELEHASHELETVVAETAEGEPLPPATLARCTALIDAIETWRGGGIAPTEPGDSPADNTRVRIAVDELDQLLAQSSSVILDRQRFVEPARELAEVAAELAVRRQLSAAQVIQLSRRISSVQRGLAAGVTALGVSASALDAQVRQLRLRNVADACQGCERIAHDIAARHDKQVDLEILGGDVKIDRAQVEPLREALIQLVRNAVVHGIEPSIQRGGKRGVISIAAEADGDAVRIVVRDDGRGIDRAAVAAKLRRDVRELSDAELERAVFAPGLSTASEITEDAGRGIGLDVVKQRIEALHGSIGVESTTGQTRFTITLPTTISTQPALLVDVRGATYAVTTTAVERVIRLELASLRDTDRGAVARVEGSWLPVAHLAAILGDDRVLSERQLPAIVLRQGQTRAVMLVDRIESLVEIVVGSLPERIGALRHIAGQTTLRSGGIALVLRVADLLADVVAVGRVASRPQEVVVTRRVLVVDDSATTRALLVNILKTAGYAVVAAVDGEAALEALSADARFDLVVSDVDMPNLDGFSLTRGIRNIERLRQLPVILVTARASDHDRKRGLEAGANAYLVKSGFDQTALLQAVARLL